MIDLGLNHEKDAILFKNDVDPFVYISRLVTASDRYVQNVIIQNTIKCYHVGWGLSIEI